MFAEDEIATEGPLASLPEVALQEHEGGAGESPGRRLTLLGQVLFCATACASRASPSHGGGVSAPTPSCRASSASPCPHAVVSSGGQSDPEDGEEPRRVCHARASSSTAPLRPQPRGVLRPGAAGGEHQQPAVVAAVVNPDVLCPTFEGVMEVFDDYEFIAAVGSGAFGRVLKVHQRCSGRARACKCLAVGSQLERGLVDTEIAVLKSLNHPHVLRLHEVYLEPGNSPGRRAYLITDLLEGGDLLFRLTYHYKTLGVPIKEGHAAYMMRQILSAVVYCHGRGVVHRDVKPDNLLFVDAGAGSPLKLIDFGLAGFAERLREAAREVSVPRSNSLARLAKLLPAHGARWLHVRRQMMQRAGTAFYMAPEMIQAGLYDQKADMFSIGMILSELLTGWHPFYTPDVDDTASVHAKITAPRSVRLPQRTFACVSKQAGDLCQRLLEKDPRRRLSAGQALVHPWFQDPNKPTPYGNLQAAGVTAETFVALRRFAASHRLRRAALEVIAWELPEAEARPLREAFLALDSGGDGVLSPQELHQASVHIGSPLDDGEAERLAAAIGGAGAGPSAGYKEVVAAILDRRVSTDETNLRRCFDRIDIEGKGFVALEDAEKLLAARCGGPLQLEAGEWADLCGGPGAALPGPGADPNSASAIAVAAGAAAGGLGLGNSGAPALSYVRFLAVMREPDAMLETSAASAEETTTTGEDDGSNTTTTGADSQRPLCPVC